MSLFLRLCGLWRGNGGWVAAGLLAAAVAVVANLVLMLTSGWFIAAMAAAGVAGASFNYFTPAAVIRACALLRTGGRYAERLLTHEATLRLVQPLRRRLFAALAPRAPFHLGAEHSGDLAGRMVADVDILQRFTLRLALPVLLALAAGAVAVGVLALGSPWLAIAGALGLAVAGGLIPWAALRLAGRAGRLQVRATGSLRAAVIDGVQGLPDLLLAGAAPRQARRLARLDAVLGRSRRHLADLEGLGQAGSALALNLTLWAVLVTGLPLLTSGSLSGAHLTGLVLLLPAVAEAIAPLPAAFAGWPGIRAAAERVFAPLDAARPPLAEAAPSPAPASVALRLEAAVVRYPGAERPALAGVSLALPPGARVAVVGASGSGKSSLIAALAGFLPLEAGTLTVDGEAAPDAAGLIAVAPQSPALLSASLRHNLTLGVVEADDAALRAACAVAGLGALLEVLPQGLDTPIGAGGRPLSGGEARRVGLARAWLRPAPLLILDEPGEGLDPRTEAEVLARMLDGLGERSLLLLTHRPAALERMDAVVVLDGGRVIASGPPWALAEREGPFRTFLEAHVA